MAKMALIQPVELHSNPSMELNQRDNQYQTPCSMVRSHTIFQGVKSKVGLLNLYNLTTYLGS